MHKIFKKIFGGADMKSKKVSNLENIECVLLRDSALGKAGYVVTLSFEDAKVYEENGFIDTHEDAVKHAKG